jgi:hypothetical protein
MQTYRPINGPKWFVRVPARLGPNSWGGRAVIEDFSCCATTVLNCLAALTLRGGMSTGTGAACAQALKSGIGRVSNN